ncbi:MAG: hypothetical protein IPN95_29135 [Bacteroidetes bacterium]|nr:hypothetical protein [Bacteroidota bacterium]
MWNRYPLLPFAFIAVLMVGCTKTYTVKVFPKGEVEVASALNFEFEDSLAPVDSIGKWSSTAYMKFDPPIKGSFRWKKRNLLTFFPENGKLPASTKIVASPNPALFFGEEAKISPEIIEFNTPFFAPERLWLSWSDNVSSTQRQPINIHLEFNYPVDPEELRKHLEVYRGDTKVESLSIYAYYATTEFEILADMQPFGPGAQPIEVRLKPGLMASTLGHSPLTETATLRDTLLPVAEVEIISVREDFDGGKYHVRIDGNQGLEANSIAPFIAIVPDMPFQVTNQNDEIILEADFKPGTSYQIGFRQGLPGTAGGLLLKDYTSEIHVPSLKPFLRFADDKGHFMMRNGYENLNVKTTNLSKFTVELYEIYENNLVHFLGSNPSNFRTWSYYDTENQYFYGDDYGYLSIEEYGALIHTDTITVPDAVRNEIADIPIKLKKQFQNKFKGIFAVQIRSVEGEGWHDDYKIVSLSDIGLIAKWNDDDLLVFANYLSTARPAAGAKISLISSTNQAFLTGVADAQGVVKFSKIGGKWDESRTFKPKLITAQIGNDLQFLDLDRSEIDQDRFDLEGKSRSTYDIFCYSDRDLYRPGDTLHFSAIVRNWDFGTPKNLPVTIKVHGPEGGLLHEMQKSTNEDGAIEINHPIDFGVRTGSYRIDVVAGVEDYYGQYTFSVEEFVPDKIKVTIGSDKTSVRPGDTLQFPLEANYYFGSACAEHDYGTIFKLRYVDFRSARYPDFDFAQRSDDNQESEWSHVDGKLDQWGRDTLEYIVPTELKGTGIASGLAQATVFDNTGHSVIAQKSFSVATRDNFLGIKEHGQYFNINDSYRLDFVPMTYNDQIAKGLKMEVKLVHFEWKRSMRKDTKGFYYVSENEAIVLKNDTITQGADINRYAHRISKAGNYELTITMLDASGSQRRQFSAYGKSVATESSFGVNREGTVAIKFDKPAYKVGEKARILLTAPFSGRMLVTLERDKVNEYRYIDIENNSAEVVFPIKDVHAPNVFVTATLFRPQKGKGQLPMTVAHGYGVIKVDNPSRILPVKITAPGIIKPGGMQSITVQTSAKAGVKMTVAVVDEGILAISGFRTPNAYAHMYAPRALTVQGYDMYEFLLPEVPNMGMATGGSDGGDWSSYGQLNPIKAKRYKPFAWWSGIQNTNSSGRLTFKVPIPEDFNGRARVMVMVYDGMQFGSGDKPMIIRDDLILMAAIPRFFTAGDSLQMPINLMNLTENAGKVKVKLTVEGPLEIDGGNEKQVEISATGNAETDFGIRAIAAGPAAILLETEGLEKLRQRVEIAVRPPTPLETRAGSGVIEAGSQATISIPGGYEPQMQRTLLTFSSFPALEFADQLDYLLNYPHGCVEQTVSSVFPQLYFGDLAELVAPEKYAQSNAVHNVREGVKKLEAMQLYDGGFSYWPNGAQYENKWGSVYATHFLLEAEKAGFAVQKVVLDRAISHLKSITTDKTTFQHRFNRNGAWISEEKASQELIYALYVLSLAGQPDVALMNYYKSRPNGLCQDSRYLLAGAFAMKKDMDSFEDLLPNGGVPDLPEKMTGGSFDSPLRSTAIMLNALVDADPSNPRVPMLLNYLKVHRKELNNTQEKAWAFLALGKIAKGSKLDNITVKAMLGAESLLTFTGENNRHLGTNLSGKTIALSAIGSGKAYYYWKIEGIKKGATVKIADRDEGLRVRREWYDTDGRRIQNPIFNQGELVVCRVKIRSTNTVENVAICDMIPAGFEVENTRLNDADYSWIKNASPNDYDNHDLRDDRVNVFTHLQAGQDREFNYLVRAVNLGRYMMPPISAEAMYDPTICSYHSGAIVRVVARDASIPGRTPIARDSLKSGNAWGSETFAATGQRVSTWDKFMLKVKSEK